MGGLSTRRCGAGTGSATRGAGAGAGVGREATAARAGVGGVLGVGRTGATAGDGGLGLPGGGESRAVGSSTIRGSPRFTAGVSNGGGAQSVAATTRRWRSTDTAMPPASRLPCHCRRNSKRPIRASIIARRSASHVAIHGVGHLPDAAHEGGELL